MKKSLTGILLAVGMLLALVPMLLAGCADDTVLTTAEDEPGGSETVSVPGTAGSSGTAPSSEPDTEAATSTFDRARLGTIERDVVYGTADGVQLKMDVYYPNEIDGQAPAVLYVHGGGWTGGDKKEGSGTGAIPALQEAGFLVFAVNYRLAPDYKFPAQIEDVKCAVRYLRANAGMYALDPERIGAMGGSAGGHLVSLLGVTDESAGLEGSSSYPDESSRVQAVVDMFGPSDLTREFNGGAVGTTLGTQVFGTSDHGADILRTASPVTYISADDPPFLILQGEKDNLVPPDQSQELYDGLLALGVPATLVMVKNAGHGFRPQGGAVSPSAPELNQLIVDFFKLRLPCR